MSQSGASRKPKRSRADGVKRFTTNLASSQRTPQAMLRSQGMSIDGRRVKEKLLPVQPPPPLPKKSKILEAVCESRGGYFNFDYGMEHGFGFGSFSAGREYGVPVLSKEALEDKELKKKKRVDASRKSMSEWKLLASQFLAELMSHEGRGDAVGMHCFKCKTATEQLVRCRDCFSRCLLCLSCMVAEHEGRPFDWVEKWNGTFFERTTLHELGLVIQLGHPARDKCSKSQRARSGFVVVDLEGIQEVTLQFCECRATEIAGDKWQQLMRARLYPATVTEPHTAFTFRTLSYFHQLTTQGKVSNYDFYHTLERRTDGSGIVDPKDRYESFIQVMRQWRYLRMLQRRVGCALPSGINMPENFSALSKQFLYHKFISIDACFRLKRRRISSEKKDPGLFTGLAYFVNQAAYQPWLKSVGDQKE
ncbi:hypothetical protein MPER_12469, partial [Moniliophthora perniciosa FA553]